MKTLMVLRHAKSPHPEGVDDHDRPIVPGAAREIAALAKRLAREGFLPEVVLSSDAVRAAETARAYAAAAGAPRPVLLPELYEPGDPEDILEAVRAHGGEARVVLVVGHNPGLEDFCNRIARKPVVERLGTGSVAVFTMDLRAWSGAAFGQARLERLETSH